MNIRKVHAAIWREQAEPKEFVRRLPFLLKVFYIGMAIWLLQYFFVWFGPFDWNEHENSPIEIYKKRAALGAQEKPLGP